MAPLGQTAAATTVAFGREAFLRALQPLVLSFLDANPSVADSVGGAIWELAGDERPLKPMILYEIKDESIFSRTPLLVGTSRANGQLEQWRT